MQQHYLFRLFSVFVFAGLVAGRRPLIRAPRDASLTGDHLVVLDNALSKEDFRQLLARISKVSDGAAVHSYVENVGKVVTASLSPYALEIVRQFPGVKHIEEEDEVTGEAMADVPWHLDRLDQTELPLDWSYDPIGTGEGVDVYVLDSGINYNHREFEFRAKYAGYDPYDVYSQRKGLHSIPQQGLDCHGHGTHVASLCGGKTFGSAKKVTIYSVRVLGCRNSAPWSVILDGLEFVSQIIEKRMKPAIVTMSLSGSYHESVNQAVSELYRKNIPVITVAGNGWMDCCSRSPASSPHAITVAGTRLGDGLYTRAMGTNFGRCVDIFAPGELIRGANYFCENCSKRLSGTSMAAPIVAGIAAIHMSRTPLMTPAQIKEKLINDSVKEVIDFSEMPETYHSLTPNRLLHLPGSCGSSTFPLSRSSFHTPMFPDRYLDNLHCKWSIHAEEGQQVQITFHSIRTERNFDVIQVLDGPCNELKHLLASISGDLGLVNLTFLSQSPSLCVVFTSDGVTQLAGFNATYTKLYRNTTVPVVVPRTRRPLRPLPQRPRPSSTILEHHWDAKDVQSVLDNHTVLGYRPIWCNTYFSGQRSHVDLILTNRSDVDTKCLLEVGNKSLPRILSRMEEQGYFLWHISTRLRGRQTLRPTFYLFFKPLPLHLEHVYYIRETEEKYLDHLVNNTRDNFTLLSHSFFYSESRLFASSVYVRDRRITHDIPIVHRPPPQWASHYNLTFDRFHELLHTYANQSFYPSSVESYADESNNSSLISVIFTEEVENRGTWFAWGLNETTAATIVQRNQGNWTPVLSVGYDYRGSENFYVQFVRKQLAL